MTIKIFGTGCRACLKLEDQVKNAVKELGLKDVKIEHVYDIEKIVEAGITFTPAVAFDDEIKAEGRIPDVEEIKNWLKEIKK